MARSDGYNTRTRQLILDYLINNCQHAVSASNILEHLEAQGASPNPTTVYRYLDKLVVAFLHLCYKKLKEVQRN